MKKLLMALGVAAFAAITSTPTIPVAHAYPFCDPGYVVGVPISDGRLPVKCVPKNNIPPGYVDGTGGNAYPGMGFKTGPDDDWYGFGSGCPCNSNDVTVTKVTAGGNAIERWGPKGCDPVLPMTGTN